jgi:hypothetical protein
MAVGRINYGSWLLRVITWDAILPVFVAAVPLAIETFLPTHRGVMEVTAVTLPVAAFFVRIAGGRRHIASNRCSDPVRRVQFGVFCVGILPLTEKRCQTPLSRKHRLW